MQHFQARPGELALIVGIGSGVLLQADQDFAGRRAGEKAPRGIGIDVELNLANPLLCELLGQWRMSIVN